MLGWLVRATCATLMVGVLGYCALMVPIGRRTLVEHAEAISQTKPAREFAEDVSHAAAVAAERLSASLR